jgi:DNA-dependent RNA polymerase auxiliary subunit epsilon
MKTYYVEETALVSIQHLVKANSKKQAIQLVKDWEQYHTEIIDYLDDDCWINVTEVWIYSK